MRFKVILLHTAVYESLAKESVDFFPGVFAITEVAK